MRCRGRLFDNNLEVRVKQSTTRLGEVVPVNRRVAESRVSPFYPCGRLLCHEKPIHQYFARELIERKEMFLAQNNHPAMPGIRERIREKRGSSPLQPPFGGNLRNEQGSQGRKLFRTEGAVLFRCFQHLLIHFNLGDLPSERNDAGNMARERISPHFKGDTLSREILLGGKKPRLIFSPIKFNFIHTSLPPMDSRTLKVR